MRGQGKVHASSEQEAKVPRRANGKARRGRISNGHRAGHRNGATSGHSPTVLEVIWGMSRLKGVSDGPARLCRMMGLPDREKTVLKTAGDALKRSYSVVHVQHNENGRVVSKDISQLNPGAMDPREWEWGGLIGFSAKVNEVVASIHAGR